MLRLDPETGGPAADRVGIKRDHIGAGYSGLLHCGSVWACPRCSAVIAMRRSLEIGAALDEVERTGGQAWLVTLTVRHDASHTLDDVWKAVSSGWREVTGTHAWTGVNARIRKGKSGKTRKVPAKPGDRDRYGIGGTIRALEATWGNPQEGGHGWHVHAHVVVMAMGDIAETVSPSEIAKELGQDESKVLDVDRRYLAWSRLAGGIYRRWKRGVEKTGMQTNLAGFDCSLIDDGGANFIGAYLQKATMDVAAKIGAEIAGGVNTKQALGRNVTPFEYLNAVIEEGGRRWFWKNPRVWDAWLEEEGLAVSDKETGEVETVPVPVHWRLWLEWEQASKGKRQILWSQRTDDAVANDRQLWWNDILAARGREQSDQEIAEVEVDGHLVAEIEASTWWRHMIHRPSWLTDLLETIEASPEDQAADVAAQWGRGHGIKVVPVLNSETVQQIL